MKSRFTLCLAVIIVVGGSIIDVSGQSGKNARDTTTTSRRAASRRIASTRKLAVRSKPVETKDSSSELPKEDLPKGNPPKGKPPTMDEVTLPESVTSRVSGDARSGNVVVNVNSNGNAVIKLGLAERGVTLIDFPAGDPVYKIHPGDENFVTVGCSERDDNGKCGNSPSDAIVLRPGRNFDALGGEERAATVVTVQRVSGIVVSFIIVPVKQISQSANYVVVYYKPADVIATRQRAGLSVNLQPGALKIDRGGVTEASLQAENAVFIDSKASGADKTRPGGTAQPSPEQVLREDVIARLKTAAKNEKGLRFSKPVRGISLSRALIASRTSDVTIEVIAVRNTLAEAVRLVPDQPELVVENREKSKTSVNVSRVDLMNIATTAAEDDVLLPGRIYYYAFAFTSPILGVQQALRVSFSQRDAADDPATLELNAR